MKSIPLKNRSIILTLLFFSMVFWHVMANIKADLLKNGFDIEYITVDESQNAILLFSKLPSPDWLQNLKLETASLQVAIKGPWYQYNDLIVTEIKEIGVNTVLLIVQSPLAISKFGLEKREFTLHYVYNGQEYVTKKEILAGSSMRFFDVSPKTTPKTFGSHLSWVFISLLCILLGYWATLMLYRKYRFKRSYITKFKTLEKEEGQVLDPFTFVPINGNDLVVHKDGQIILVSSWKAIRKLKNQKLFDKYGHFFGEYHSGTFAMGHHGLLSIFLRSCKPLMGITLGWIGYELVSDQITKKSIDFENTELSLNGMEGDLVLGFFMGLGIFLAGALYDGISKKNGGFSKSALKDSIKEGSLVFGAFVFSILIAFVFVQRFYLSAFMGWGILGITFVLIQPLELRKWRVMVGLVSGWLSLILFLALNTSVFQPELGTKLPLYFALLLLPMLIQWLSWAMGLKSGLRKIFKISKAKAVMFRREEEDVVYKKIREEERKMPSRNTIIRTKEKDLVG